MAGDISSLGDLGYLAVILIPGVTLMSVLIMALSFVAPNSSSRWGIGEAQAVRFHRMAIWVSAILAVIAFAALIGSFLSDDFVLKSVWKYSHSQQPLLYKVIGVWGNHEGSMLLWLLILTLYSLGIGLWRRGDGPEAVSQSDRKLQFVAGALQQSLLLGFALYVAYLSNPFELNDQLASEGRSLNPLLQDIALAIHPPLLYLGYAGFSVTFCYAAAASIVDSRSTDWIDRTRSYLLLSWGLLTCGIATGSYWAYYELGWGGFWFWDPVENSSLLPWLAATALLHSMPVTQKLKALPVWTLFLALLTFSLSLLGMLLVRSGLLTSVHSFASDPSRGLALVALLIVYVGGAFSIFAWRVTSFREHRVVRLASREGFLLLNNLILVSLCAVILVGTLYPLASELFLDFPVSVGAPYFLAVTLPLFAPVMFFAPLSLLVPWKRVKRARLVRWLMTLAVLVTISVALFVSSDGALEYGLTDYAMIFLVFWAFIAALLVLVEPKLREWREKRRSLKRGFYGAAFAHFGLATLLMGVLLTSFGSREQSLSMPIGSEHEFSGFSVRLTGFERLQEQNYIEQRASIRLLSEHGETILHPAIRNYLPNGEETTEAAIVTYGLTQFYITLGEVVSGDRLLIRLQYRPYILLIWLGAAIMAAAAFGSCVRRVSSRQVGHQVSRQVGRQVSQEASRELNNEKLRQS